MPALLIGYLLLAWLGGVALTYVSRMPWQLEGRLMVGLPLGFSAAAMLTWLGAIPFGMSGATVLEGAVALLLVVAACARWTDWRPRLRGEARAMIDRWRRREALALAVLGALAFAFFIPFYSHALENRPDGLWAGYVNIWGDWCTHLSMSGYLSGARHLLPPQNPFYSGVGLTYPFLPDFFSAILVNFGIGPDVSLVLASAILSLALVGVFHSTALRFLGSTWAACLATLLFFMSGGLGFLRLLDDVHPAGGGVGGWLTALGQAIAHPIREYTLDRGVGYQWLNPVLAYLVPQRTTLFGFSLGLLVLSILWYGRRSGDGREMLLAGILLGLLPLVHTSTYVDLLLLTFGLALLDLALGWFRVGGWSPKPRHWLAFFVPALLIAAPQILMIAPPATYRHDFLRIQLGWLAAGEPQYRFPVAIFWVLNTALLIPLALMSYLSDRWGRPGLGRFLAPAWLLFIIPNLFVLQPWDWDNTKWFVWWAILASMLAGLVLYQLFRRGPALAMVGVLLLVLCTGAGFLDLTRAWQKDLSSYRLLDRDELAVAGWARDQARPEAVFLTGWKNDHPILTLSRHPEVMGYPGWIWSWGLNVDPRQQDVVQMFQGGPRTTGLLKQYNVAYVVIGPSELTSFPDGPGANVDYYRNRYPVVYSSLPRGEYKIYRVS